ncbi:ABC transporter ATP-binding protein [Paenibacillus sp. GYB003]|uniref:ABC transporter ATP-binding protein n=1 Tax=Paenibacillus sp. GYB003 TaxID=2994392 RepID=UPI002F968A9F
MNGSMRAPSASRSAVWTYVKTHIGPRWPNLVLILLKNVIGSLLYMVPPLLTKYMLETVLPSRDWSFLVIVAIVMVAAPIAGSAMIIAEDYFGRFMIRLTGQGRAELYDGIQRLPLGKLRHSPGDLLARMLNDTYAIGELANGNLGFMLFHVVTIVVGSAVLLALHPGLGAVVLLLWAGQAFLLSSLGGRVKQRAAETARHNSLVAETVREIVSAAPFLKAAGQEGKALAALRDCLRREWGHTKRGQMTDYRVQLANAALGASFLVIMYGAGGWLVLEGRMTVGSLVAFVAVYTWLRPFGVSLIGMALAAIKVAPAVDRVAEIACPAAREGGSAVPAGPLTLEADRLSFRYPEGAEGDGVGKLALRDVSFRIAPGSVVSVVGHRGSGKSTLADLLLGLRRPSSGIISVNGVPLPALDRDWLRRHLLCITQETRLRSGTIRDNLVYGSEDADPEAVREAVRLAELEEWISRLPDGWFTRVGEQGLQLSGGERQRIAIARALLRKPSILVLDEATSALDPGTEHRLLLNLTGGLKGCTLLFITHRLQVAKRSDRILVLQGGSLAESGTYEELLAGPTLFRSLCEHAAGNRSRRSL